MKKPLIMFGTGKIAEASSYYFDRDSEYQIAAYVCDDAFVSSASFLGRPVVGLSRVLELYPPSAFAVFVAVGYQGINRLRISKYEYFKAQGYGFASYISPSVQTNVTIGENTIVMDHAMIQPCVTVGSNVMVWGGAMIGHHAVIGDHCWLTGGCMIGGAAHIGTGTFIGMGTVVGQEVRVGERCMLGASTLTTKSIGDGVVLIAPPTEPHRLNSEQFMRMSACFSMPKKS
jgi:sugar O-acyltransferase (sialic acid O-acetyltransferase NeuD family)